MIKYLLNAVNTYRVETVDDVLALRKELSTLPQGELVSFSYATKYNKKTEEEYQVVKAKIKFNEEKEPENVIGIKYKYGEFDD